MKKLVVLLHGVGSSGADLEGLGHYFQPSFPDVIFSSPNGTEKFDGGGAGYQWFSVTGVTEASRPGRIVNARAAFDAAIQQIFAKHAIDPEQDQVIFLGFSQGSIMALDALVSARLPLAGVVAFSGRLSSPQPYATASNTPVLLVHGQADPVIPWQESESAAAKLSEVGIPVTTFFETALPHTISMDGINKATAFISQCFSKA